MRRGDASPAELLEAAIARVERLDPVLNAVVIRLFDEARAAARAPGPPDGPLRGVPFLLKDLGATQAGLPYTAGNGALRAAGYRSPTDTTLGARIRSAGLVVLGRTNTPEFGLQSVTQPRAYGATRNPWSPDHTPGSTGCASPRRPAAG